MTRRTLRAIWSALCLIAVTATAPPPDPAAVVHILHAQDEAILRVGERLAVAGRPFCRDQIGSAGVTVQVLAQYGAAYRAAAAELYGIGDLPTVVSIADGSAAAAALIQPGDRIAAIGTQAFVPNPAKGERGDFAVADAMLDRLEAGLQDGPVTLKILRKMQPLRTVTLTPQPSCRARFDVRAGRSSNASSDGTYVQVASDLVADTRGDGELAAILAHELSHNILRHPQRLKAKGPRPSVRQTEVEADRLSVYLLDAAGYGIAGAETFWGRWGRAHDKGIFAAGSHPGWRQRIATIQAEAASIAAQRAAGRVVTAPPELRPPG